MCGLVRKLQKENILSFRFKLRIHPYTPFPHFPLIWDSNFWEAVRRQPEENECVLTKEKKLAWQSSRLAPLVWLLAPVMLKTCPKSGLLEVARDPQRVAVGVLGAQISGAWAAIMANLCPKKPAERYVFYRIN